MIVDDNYVTKSNLTITVKTLTKYNDRSKVAAKQTNKQTNRLRDKETDKHLGRKIKKKTYLQLDLLLLQLELHLLSTHIQKEVNKK